MKSLIAILALAALQGCVTYSADGGFGAVATAAKDRGVHQDVKWLRTAQDAEQARLSVKQLLDGPITADGAVQIALLNNRALQAIYADLGIAESDLVQAARLPNPVFAFEHLSRGNVVSIDRTFLFNVLALVTLPARTDVERRRFELAQVRVASAVLQVASDTRRAWYSAVAAQETARYLAQASAAAEAGAELARRMTATGNFSKLDQSRERAFYAEVTAQLARARQSALVERERLTRLMGLSDTDAGFALLERLPDLPASFSEIAELGSLSLSQRLDVLGAMKSAENIAASLGLTRATGFVDLLEIGYRRNSETGQPRQAGYEVDLRLPLFDWGGARVARAEFTYMQAVNRASDIAVRARSEVREAHAARQTAFELARHYRDEVVPLRKRISEENLLRYNGMLISVFELLADARQQIAAVNAYIEALRDYWMAETNLQMVMTGGSPVSMSFAGAAATAGIGAQAGH